MIYQNDSVFVDGQDVGSARQYYQQAADLAKVGEEAVSDDDQWLPLGVFAITNDRHTDADLVLQLAVNKAGVIRGNFVASQTDQTLPVQGSIDKKTQRAAWTIGDNKQNVFETGVLNLTKDEVPALVHRGDDKAEQWTLVRLSE